MPELLLLSLVLGAYFLPWILAAVREHPQREAICVVNLFFGWTVIGWWAALVWSLLGGSERA